MIFEIRNEVKVDGAPGTYNAGCELDHSCAYECLNCFPTCGLEYLHLLLIIKQKLPLRYANRFLNYFFNEINDQSILLRT